MICSNCGADISSNDIKCPYCGAMQYEASEKKYMNDLYKINSDMDNLDKNVRRYALLSIAKSIGYVLIGTAAALVIGVAIGRFDYKQYNDSRKERNEIHKAMDWYDDNSAKLDESFMRSEPQDARTLVWALPFSLAATHRITCCFLFLRLLRCFSSPGSLPYVMDWRMDDRGLLSRVSPFGYLRINGYLLLPEAFRSLSRLSSALSAKASTLRSF